MKINLNRLLKYFGGEAAAGGKMSSLRFLPNTMADFAAAPEEERPLQVPQDHLKKTVNDMLERINRHLEPSVKNASDGLYLGTAGVALMYYRLSKNPALRADRRKLLRLAYDYLKPALTVAERDAANTSEIPSFILGNCGIYATAAVVLNALAQKEESERYFNLYKEAAKICQQPNFLNCGSDELFVGRAGYLLGAVWLCRELGTAPPQAELYAVCRATVESGREYARRRRGRGGSGGSGGDCPPLMYAYYRVEYLGAAHGLSSVLQALLSVPGYLADHPADEADVRASVDHLLQLQDAEANWPSDTEERGPHHHLVHWCHGAPGTVYLMARAYLTWRDERYARACLRAGDLVWEKGLLRKGPGLCHGVAGNGYVFLLLYRLTSNPKFLHRAIAFAQFLETDAFKRKARTPDHPYSLYEGLAGTVCFVADLLDPGQAAFPFSDVF